MKFQKLLVELGLRTQLMTLPSKVLWVCQWPSHPPSRINYSREGLPPACEYVMNVLTTARPRGACVAPCGDLFPATFWA